MAITTNIKLRRRLRLTRGRLVGRMSQERQKLSFFLVLMFLAIFGIIVLAEVLFMDGDHKSDIFYEDSNIISDEDSSNTYETPKPFGKCQIVVGLLSYTGALRSLYYFLKDLAISLCFSDGSDIVKY